MGPQDEDNSCEGSQGKEPCMPHGYLTRVSNKDIQADSHNGMNGDEVDNVDGKP
jgi:hypothetical protein